MAELVDASDSKSDSARSAGSIPARGTSTQFFHSVHQVTFSLQNQIVARRTRRIATHSTTLLRADFGVDSWKLPRLPRRPYPSRAHPWPSRTLTSKTRDPRQSPSSSLMAAACSSSCSPTAANTGDCAISISAKSARSRSARIRSSLWRRLGTRGSRPSGTLLPAPIRPSKRSLTRIAAETAANNTFGLIAAEYLEGLEATGASAVDCSKKTTGFLRRPGPAAR